jgi:myo-inositol-1(or 4)-monophosphatase
VLLRDGLDRQRATVDTKSTRTDMVTEMDRAAEALIVRELLGARPDDGMLGEEGTDRPGTSGVRWIVDPLDGTTNYLYALPGFAVSIAAEVDGSVRAGVVYDVVHDELFAATTGGGATRNDAPIVASDQHELPLALIATGFAYDAARRAAQAAALVHVLPHVRDVRRFGAAAVDLCSVACGRVDAYYERGLAVWDLAAGGLIASEAGAIVTSFDGGPAEAGTVVAAAPGIAEDLRALLRSAGAADA